MLNKREASSFAVIILISLLSYFNTFENSFHFDDYEYNYVLNDAFKEHVNYPFTISNFSNRSVVLHSLYLNYSVGGFNVFGFHVFNISIHTLTCLLIFILLKETLRNFRFSKTGFTSDTGINIPLLSSLLFAVHPINTQAVTYISSRSSLLAAFFYLSSLILFIKGASQSRLFENCARQSKFHNSPSYLAYLKILLFLLLSVIFMGLGYGSKTIIITVPFVIIIYYLFFISHIASLPKTTFLKLFFSNKITKIVLQAVVLSSPLALILFSKYLNYRNITSIDNESLPKFLQLLYRKLSFIAEFNKVHGVVNSSIYLLTEFKVIVFYYIKMIFFPFNQNIDPDFPVAFKIMDPGVVLSLTIITLCLFAGIYFCKKNRLIAFGIFWFFITLLPTSSVLPLLDTVTEHRLYLPSIGIAIIIPVFINLSIHYNKSFFKKITDLLFIFLTIIILSTLTVKRNFVWKNEVTLWSDAAEKSPLKPRPFNNLGEAYEKKAEYQKAIHSLKKAISLAPDYDYAHNNLGTVYGKLNQFDLAIKEYLHVLEVNDQFTSTHYNLGKSYEMKGMLDEAVQEYSKAIGQQRDFYQAHFNLASIYSRRESYKEAISSYQEFLKYKPSYPAAHFELGKIYIKTENPDIAFSYFSKAVKLDSSYVPARIALGNIFMMRGSYDEAEETYQQVLKLDPDNFTAYNNLGLIYLRYKNKPSQAIYYFQKSLKINPSQPDAKSVMETIKKILNN